MKLDEDFDKPLPGEDIATTTTPSLHKSSLPGATYALVVLTCINLLNYIDRWIPSATKELIKSDLRLTDAQTSIPYSAFLVVYMLTCPVFGMLSDRGVPRRILLATGIVLWSVSTAAAFFAVDFWTFLVSRMMVGIGEAAYATITPALLCDFNPIEKRNRVLTIFYTEIHPAIPVGSALGFVLGGILGQYLGWRFAFMICGIPGILIALLTLRIKEPGRGHFDGGKMEDVTWLEVLRSLSRNKLYINTVAGSVLFTFAVGGIGDWIPAYLHRVDNFDIDTSGTVAGIATVIGGLGGTALGGFVADALWGKTRQPYLAVSSLSSFIATAGCALILMSRSFWLVVFQLIAVQLFLWCNTGPTNTLIANSVSASIRTRAFSISILSVHLFGDAISPVIIGATSDATGSLVIASVMIPVILFLGALVWGIGWRTLKEPSNVILELADEDEEELLQDELSEVDETPTGNEQDKVSL